MVERTLSSFPKFLSEGIGNLLSPGSQNKGPAAEISRGFVTFLSTVHRHDKTGGKYETEQAFQQELSLIQQKISSPGVTQAQIRDYLCRAIYSGMLGYDVSFAYIYAIKLAQQGTLLEKRIGYLAASLLLHPGHEMVLLLVSTIQKDLNSSNLLDNCMALTAASQMIGIEMIPILLPAVLDSLKHKRELVRQKAVMCLYRFQLLAPDLLAHVQTDLERALFDKDPGVMAAAVNIVNHNIQQSPTKYLHLADTLISIQQQIMSRKMSAMFEYQSVPFPWLQIKLLRCISNLSAVDEQVRKKISPLLIEVLQRASSKEYIAYALIYECLQCISVVKPDGKVIGEAVTHVGRFMRSADPNLRYVGVKALLGLVKVDASFVMDYQNLIVDSLEHSDQTIQRKMYKLLYQITNPTNVEVISDKLLHQLEISLDKFWRSEVITMVMDLTKRFSPSVTWQYSTKLRCLQLGGNSVRPSAIESVISSFKTGCSSDKMDLKQFLVKKCVECLMSDKTHYNVIHVTAWSLAELSPLLTKLPEDRVMSLYTRHLCNPDLPDSVKACLISGLQKLMCGNILSKETMATRLAECLKFKQPVLIKQQITVLHRLCKIGTNIKLCREPEEFDFTLSFLDSCICQCIEDGARTYKPRHLRFVIKREEATPQDVTEVKATPGVKSRETASDSVYSSSHYRTSSTTSSERLKEESEAKLDLSGVKRVWGKQGIITKNQEPRMTQLQSEGSSDDRKQHERQQMAAALFGGMTAMGNEKGHLEGDELSGSTFGAYDQDVTTLLPSSDSGGWRSCHRDHAEKNESVVKEIKKHSLDSLKSETANERTENKTSHLDHEDHGSLNFPTTRMADHDTGYESKLLYDEFTATDPVLGGNLELNQNANVSDLNNAASNKQNNSLFSDDTFDENCLTNQDMENNTKSEFTSVSAHVPNYMSVNEEEQATRNDLDEALSLLLNDSSSFVNISIVSQDQNSSLLDSCDTGNSAVKVRQSGYSLKEDRTFDDLNNLHNKEAKTVQEETDMVIDGDDKGAAGGSLYDDDDT